MEQKISFGELRDFLEGLGFTESVKPTHLVFEHAASQTMLIFRRYRRGEAVTPANLTATRKLLDEKGLIPAAEFDSRLRKAPA
jgi:hypothetical protein